MTDAFEHIIESKQRERKRLAALPFAEKIKILERLRDRDAAIIAGRKGSANAPLPDRVLILREQRARYVAETGKGDRDAGC